MGITWQIRKPERLVIFRLFGQSGVLETVDSLRELAADPGFDPAMRRLYLCEKDLHQPSGLDSTHGALADVLADQVTRMFDHPATVAFVYDRDNTVARDRFHATAARCDEIFRNQGRAPMNHRAFHSLAPALEWLGLPQDFEP